MVLANRIRRGLWRLGLLVAVPSWAGAAVFLALGGLDYVTTPHVAQKSVPEFGLTDEQMMAAGAKPLSGRFTLIEPAAPGAGEGRNPFAQFDHSQRAMTDRESRHAEQFRVAAVWLALGMVWLSLCWAVGWIAAGFMEDGSDAPDGK